MALLLLATLGVVCWLVVKPVLEAKSAAEDLSHSVPHQMLSSPERAAPLIARLGGSDEAARKLGLFLRMPKWAGGADDRLQWPAVVLLAHSGDAALPVLAALLDDRNQNTRGLAALGTVIYCLSTEWPEPPPPALALPMPWTSADQGLSDMPALDFSRVLESRRNDNDPQVRDVAAKASRIWKARLMAIPPRPY